jgi:hypothetical protein
MTRETRTDTVEESAANATMGEFSHSNPYTGRTFGDELAFTRGGAVAADGGRADADDEQTMEDVDHEHPEDDAAEANRVFARGKGGDDEDGDQEAV